MRGRFLILFAMTCGAAFPAAGHRACGRYLALGLTDIERGKDQETLGLLPYDSDPALRRGLSLAAESLDHVVKHGRGTLPAGLWLSEAKALLPEITRLAETDDAEGMRRLLADPITESRLGAKIDRRFVEIRAADLLALNGRLIPRLGESNVDFVEWFVDTYFDIRGNEQALFEPHADAARRKAILEAYEKAKIEPPPWTDKTNLVTVPDRVSVHWIEGESFCLPTQTDDLLALKALPRTQLDRERLHLLAVQTVLAGWEEMFHAIDWAIWTATGESASPAMNRLCRHLGVRYEWWAHGELAVALYGRYDSKVLAPKDAVRESFWRNYPKLRHLIGQSPRLDAILK